MKQKDYNDWTNIKDKLPKPHERVLLLRTVGRFQKIVVGFWSNNNFWYDIDDLWNVPLTNITHWKQLPNLPEQINENELLPCPFCGGKAEMQQVDGYGFYIYCSNDMCNVQVETPFYPSKKIVIEAWNERDNLVGDKNEDS